MSKKIQPQDKPVDGFDLRSAVWRKHVNSQLVDLSKFRKDTIKKSKAGSLYKKQPKSQYKKQQRPIKSKAVAYSQQHLSRDVLFEELSALDRHDLHIQKSIKKKETDRPQTYSANLGPAHIIKEDDIRFIYSLAPKRIKRELRQQVLGPSIISRDAFNQNVYKQNGADEFIASPSLHKTKTRKKRLKKFSKLSLSIFFIFLISSAFASIRAFAFKDEAQLHTENAYEYMQLGKDALFEFDAENAQDNFLKAKKEFDKIEAGLSFLGQDMIGLASQFPIQSRVVSNAHLIRAGKFFANAGYEVALSIVPLQNIESLPYSDNVSMGVSTSFTDSIYIASQHLKLAGEHLKIANSELIEVRQNDIPSNFKQDVLSIQSKTNNIEYALEEVVASADILLEFLGHNAPRSYLLLFQNSSELRANGGFIGTYGLLKLNKGKMESLLVDGIYNPDGQLSIKIIPPKPLQYVTDRWETRDANWFFDFSASAKTISWFYEQTGGEKPDGVIAVTPLLVEKLLAITGEIDMPSYGTKLNKDNFLEVVQKEVEVDYDKELNRPKQILSDLTPLLLERLSKSDSKVEIISAVLESLKRKDIQVYSQDLTVEEFVLKQNWGGAIEQIQSEKGIIGDYLGVVFTNLGGWKTDKYIETEIDTVTTINENNEIVRTVIISKKHNGGKTPYVWYNKPNYSYVRIYTPKESEIISTEGFSEEPSKYKSLDYSRGGFVDNPRWAAIKKTFRKDEATNTDIFEESGKTAFGNWLLVPAGERRLVKIVYKLPNKYTKLDTAYSLTIQKQAGINVSYSGSIEASSIEICAKSGQPILNNKFFFAQTQDENISCNFK